MFQGFRDNEMSRCDMEGFGYEFIWASLFFQEEGGDPNLHSVRDGHMCIGILIPWRADLVAFTP